MSQNHIVFACQKRLPKKVIRSTRPFQYQLNRTIIIIWTEKLFAEWPKVPVLDGGGLFKDYEVSTQGGSLECRHF